MDNFEQVASRLHREGQSLTSNARVEVFNPDNMDKVVKDMLSMKNKIAENRKKIMTCGLVCPDSYEKIKEFAISNNRSGTSLIVTHAFCGVEIQSLKGLHGEALLFNDRGMMKDFLDMVDSNKSLMLHSDERAVKEAINFFDYLGRIDKGDIVSKELNMRDRKSVV